MDTYKLFFLKSGTSPSSCSVEGYCNVFEICHNGVCISQSDYVYKSDECQDCPEIGNVPSTEVFITASQIALSAALLMGVAALVMVIYRLCTKPRYLSARAAAAHRTANGTALDNSYSNYLRASLTSIQIRVLTRLRDRPPSYECRETSSITMIESPPPYEESGNLGIHQPPPYTEIILSPTGYLNISFVENETNPNSQDSGRTSSIKNQSNTSVNDTFTEQQTNNDNTTTCHITHESNSNETASSRNNANSSNDPL